MVADPTFKEIIEHGHTIGPAMAAAVSAKTKPFPGIRILESVSSALVIGGLTWAYQTMVAIPEIKREIQYVVADTQKDLGHLRAELSELKAVRAELVELKIEMELLRAQGSYRNAIRR